MSSSWFGSFDQKDWALYGQAVARCRPALRSAGRGCHFEQIGDHIFGQLAVALLAVGVADGAALGAHEAVVVRLATDDQNQSAEIGYFREEILENVGVEVQRVFVARAEAVKVLIGEGSAAGFGQSFEERVIGREFWADGAEVDVHAVRRGLGRIAKDVDVLRGVRSIQFGELGVLRVKQKIAVDEHAIGARVGERAERVVVQIFGREVGHSVIRAPGRRGDLDRPRGSALRFAGRENRSAAQAQFVSRWTQPDQSEDASAA